MTPPSQASAELNLVTGTRPRLTASPMRAVPKVVSGTHRSAHATVTIAPDEPVLAGHYPGAPILPGVCLLELFHQSARMIATRRALQIDLTKIVSARFLKPVRPGDTLDLDVDVQQDGPTWLVHTVASTGQGRAAEAVLSYEPRPVR